MFRPSFIGLVYIVVGVAVAASYDYFKNLDTLRRIASAILAVVLWPLLLLGNRPPHQEVTASCSYTSPPKWPANESSWRCKEREGRGSRRFAAPAHGGPRAGRPLRAGEAAPSVRRARARAAARADRRLRPARDPRRRPRRPGDDAPGRAQGLPAGVRARQARAHRPARGAPRPADPGAGRGRARSASRPA